MPLKRRATQVCKVWDQPFTGGFCCTEPKMQAMPRLPTGNYTSFIAETRRCPSLAPEICNILGDLGPIVPAILRQEQRLQQSTKKVSGFTNCTGSQCTVMAAVGCRFR
jgi:hypothetical protein